ncbi:unnamed protein product [Symbiodinium microadriaticum]|nr:unnamed protein product [Symbiodinium microadriaticum]
MASPWRLRRVRRCRKGISEVARRITFRLLGCGVHRRGIPVSQVGIRDLHDLHPLDLAEYVHLLLPRALEKLVGSGSKFKAPSQQQFAALVRSPLWNGLAGGCHVLDFLGSLRCHQRGQRGTRPPNHTPEHLPPQPQRRTHERGARQPHLWGEHLPFDFRDPLDLNARALSR